MPEVSFERFDEQTRAVIVSAQEECRRLGHPDFGADHLLIGFALVDETILGAPPDRLRAAVVRLRSERRGTPRRLPFSEEAKAAIQAVAAAGHPRVRPGHLLLALLDAGDTAARVLETAGLTEAGVRAAAARAAERRGPRPHVAATVGGSVAALEEGRFEDALRDGHPVPVRLHNAPPLGDLGHPRVDARLLKLVLAADGRLGRVLRDHGVDERAVDAALDPPT